MTFQFEATLASSSCVHGCSCWVHSETLRCWYSSGITE